MKITIWGARGSLPSPGPETGRFGGNTSCVQVAGTGGTVLVLDAGTGIRRLSRAALPPGLRCDILLTHLHMDHIQGLGFFGPLFEPDREVHIWGPASTTQTLRSRLNRYLSPPLFPVHLRDLPSRLTLHEVPAAAVEIGEFRVRSELVCHPGPTVGYRITDGARTLTYLPDHEPVLGGARLTTQPEWLSGYALAEGADLLLHDAQYTSAEYAARVGWGHSALPHLFDFARLTGVRHLVPFHHDPAHSDDDLEQLFAQAVVEHRPACQVSPAVEGQIFDLPA